MKFKDVVIGQFFTEDTTCEIIIKVSQTLSQVYDMEKKSIYVDKITGTIDLEFPLDHNVDGDV